MGGSGTFTVPAGTTLRLRTYSFTNTPPSYWSTWIAATMSGAVAYNGGSISAGSITLYPNNGTMDFNASPDFTVVAGGNYTINVSTYSPVPPSPTPSTTPSITPSITPTSSPCVCVCGTTITNTAGYTINGSWTDCYEVVHGFSLGAYQAYALPCSGPEGSNIYVKYGSVTADGPFTVSYGSCTPPPTQTPTPSVTPSSTPPPAYAHCLEYSSVSCNDACTNYIGCNL